MEKTNLLYEGKAKKVYETNDPSLLIVDYKDDATAFNGLKKGTIAGKGEINNRVTNHLMKLLEKNGVPTHFVEELSPRETAVKRVSIVPLEVIVRNIAAGSLAKRLGLAEGTKMKKTVLEFCYKDDELGDPMVNEYHILAMEYCTEEELKLISQYALKVNEVLSAYLKDLGIELIDFKLEFGRLADGTIVLADEISPDTCRFWDSATGEKLDKDRFRRDLGHVEDAYHEILRRLITACTPCSTAARKAAASPSTTTASSTATRARGWSATSSPPKPCTRWARDRWPWRTCATAPWAPTPASTPSRWWSTTSRAAWRWRTTAP